MFYPSDEPHCFAGDDSDDVHICIQHSGENVHFFHLISDFWQRKIMRARAQITSSVTDLRGSNCPTTLVSLPEVISQTVEHLFRHTQFIKCFLKSPITNPNLFNFFNDSSILNRLSAPIKPDQTEHRSNDEERHRFRLQQPLWRNRLARLAVNQKVGSSNPPRGVRF